jgi:hypothetical protein
MEAINHLFWIYGLSSESLFFKRPSLLMTVSACNKMNVIYACSVFVGGIHLLHIQLAVGNGRVAIFTGRYC